jgi:hypothetical protein
MSGGSYDYAYDVVERFAEALENGKTFQDRTPLDANSHVRLGFAAHLRKVAAAMKAIEWSDSADSSEEEAVAAIHAVTGT